MSEPQKKMYSRAEFEQLRKDEAARMVGDKKLWADALDVKYRAGEYFWIHQTNWLGEPCLQLPQDMFAMQEIIFNTKPRYIIEVGTAWGGSLLFYSTLLEILGGGEIIGIDIYIPDDLKARIASYGKLSERIHWLDGSSIDPATVEKVNKITGGSREVMILLDSHHTHDHVIQELNLYSPLVGKGYYLICGDTTIEYQPESKVRLRPWGKGNSPKSALDAFMKTNDRFAVDTLIENKLLLTNNPGGYLKCLKD
ncbi:MAG: hypothetical protein JNM27_22490 [Leptospirales bacterium]|nr:hypothetical protein [Leptospirales bacterium]